MEEKIKFGKFIAKKRKEKNLTQKQFAERLIVTESAVSKWERGVSYPDITLVSAICSILEISEHELITATDDVHQRQVENQAKHFLRILRSLEYFFYISYGITLIACFICNLAIDHTLSWFFIVLCGVMVGFSVTSLPILLKNVRLIKTIFAFFGTVNILLLVCCIYTKGDWFIVAFMGMLVALAVFMLPFVLKYIRIPEYFNQHKVLFCYLVDSALILLLVIITCIYSGNADHIVTEAVPITLIGICYPWFLMLAIRYGKGNKLNKAGICVIITGIYSMLVNGFVGYITGQNDSIVMPINFTNWNTNYTTGNISCIIAISAFAIGALLILFGTQGRKTQK